MFLWNLEDYVASSYNAPPKPHTFESDVSTYKGTLS